MKKYFRTAKDFKNLVELIEIEMKLKFIPLLVYCCEDCKKDNKHDNNYCLQYTSAN